MDGRRRRRRAGVSRRRPTWSRSRANALTHGGYAAKLTVDGDTTASRAAAPSSRARARRCPPRPTTAPGITSRAASASVNVGTYWVIFKFRQRESATMVDELLRPGSDQPADRRDERCGSTITAVATSCRWTCRPRRAGRQWFQIEAYYRNTPGRHRSAHVLARWPPDRRRSPTSRWRRRRASSGTRAASAQDLTPSTAVLYVDDCAVSRTRVGPSGIIAD